MAKWNFNATMEESAKYQSRSAFCAGSRHAYESAKQQGLLDLLFPPVPRKRKVFTEQELRTIAANYSSLSAFYYGNRAAHGACSVSLRDELFPMNQIKRRTIQSVLPSPVQTTTPWEPSAAQKADIRNLDTLDDPMADYQWINSQPVDERADLLDYIVDGRK